MLINIKVTVKISKLIHNFRKVDLYYKQIDLNIEFFMLIRYLVSTCSIRNGFVLVRNSLLR